jgi:hypothetical protein
VGFVRRLMKGQARCHTELLEKSIFALNVVLKLSMPGS